MSIIIILQEKKKNININIEDLFDKDELELNEDVIRTIKHFYKIDENKGIDILYYSNNKELDSKKYNFVLNIIELVYTKKNLMMKDFDKTKTCLIRLERNIYDITKNIFYKKDDNKICEKYAKNSTIKKIYDRLIYELKNIDKIDKDVSKNIYFYPVGSLTEFLYLSDKKNKQEDDLDIYLDIHKLSIQQRSDALFKIYQYLKKYNARKTINSINCIFKIIYQGINISLIVLGLGPYIHSILFREYSLMDPRFPIIAITLKYFLKKIGLKDKSYLNTFSLMSLLIAFLQDIIYPPILPKIFSDKHPETEIIYKLFPFTSEDNEKKLKTFIKTINYKNLNIPKIIFEKDKIKKLYKEQINDNFDKNNLSCSQIFLYFLEFLIYYFKFDSLYVNCSISKEGFDSMNNIIHNEDDDDEDSININNNDNDIKNHNDIYFKEFFKEKYYHKRNKDEIDQNKKKRGIFLIRDPMNPFYNPADSLNSKEFNIFFDKIKKGHEILLNTGSFDKLDRLNSK